MLKRLLPLTIAVLMPLTASAKVLWRGDFETGDRSQWSKAQEVSADRLVVQTDKVKEGKYALKTTVHLGDNPINASGNRNELVDANYQPEGAERYYRWFTYFDEGYPSERTWQVFTQWHQYEDHGSPPIEFDVYGEEIHLTNSENVIWRAPLQRGVWHEFIFHVKWSKDASVGFVELWYDGQKVLEKTYLRTDSKVYLKQGLYRNNTIEGLGVVYHDGMVMGETLDDVKPADPTPPTDTGSGSGSGSGTGGTDPNGGTGSSGSGTGTTGGTTGGTGGTTTTPAPTGSSNNYGASEQQAGCSTTGASLAPIAGVLLAMAALGRRKRASVRVRK